MPSKSGYKKMNRNKKAKKYQKPTKYPNARATAIQRMDLVPNTSLLKCVFDETYLLKGSALSKNNTFGMTFNLSDLFNGPASTQTFTTPASPYWGAANFTDSTNMSGNSNQAKPPGFSRYIWSGDATDEAPYRNYTVVGGKYTIRAEQLHTTEGAGAPATSLTKLIAICSRLSRQNLYQNQGDTKLSQWQAGRGIQQSNLTALVASGTNRPTTASAQQMRQTGTFSTKKFFDIKDIKDNMDRLGGSFNEDGDYIPPEESCYLNIGVFDRLPIGDDSGYVMPDFSIRVRYEALVLCSETNQLANLQP